MCIYIFKQKLYSASSQKGSVMERRRERGDWGLFIAHVSTICSRSAQSNICSIIFIWFIIEHTRPPPPPNTNLEKEKNLSCYSWLFLNYPIEMATESSEAIQVPPWLSSDVLCTRKRGKNRSIFLFLLCFNLIWWCLNRLGHAFLDGNFTTPYVSLTR